MRIFFVTFLVSIIGFTSVSNAAEPPEDEVATDSWNGNSLDIKAPDMLVLGRDDTATISFDRPEGGTPILVTNVGSISDPVKARRGRLKAVYTAPDQKTPQVAIIAILNEDRLLLDWIALPLYGKARIDSKTEAGASVRIKIAGETFGPVVAGNDGKTSIDVVVPPGVKKGFTIAKDEVGNTVKTPTALGTPTFNRSLGVCPNTGDRFYVLIVDEKGKPKEKAEAALDVFTSKGKLSKPKIISNGVYVSMLDVTSDVVEGEAVELTAMLGKFSSSCDLEFGQAPPPPLGRGQRGRSRCSGRRETCIRQTAPNFWAEGWLRK